MTTIDLNDLSEYFPWGQVYEDLGYAMPYPEVMMTSDRAYALQAQVTGLLMMQSWGAGNSAAYTLERAEATYLAYTLTIDLQLPSIDEAWALIGIPEERLRDYMRLSLVRYVSDKVLPEGSTFRLVPLSEERYMFVGV
ncbi:MAG: hypothetical protein SPK09_03095 [Porphyromonas sp.]|nr:hypothetical protein [Porphyromonas sp.]